MESYVDISKLPEHIVNQINEKVDELVKIRDSLNAQIQACREIIKDDITPKFRTHMDVYKEALDSEYDQYVANRKSKHLLLQLLTFGLYKPKIKTMNQYLENTPYYIHYAPPQQMLSYESPHSPSVKFIDSYSMGFCEFLLQSRTIYRELAKFEKHYIKLNKVLPDLLCIHQSITHKHVKISKLTLDRLNELLEFEYERS